MTHDTKLSLSDASEIASRLSVNAPVLTRERFAASVGLPIGVVVGFINKGYLPTLRLGKHSLVNVELLRKRCLAKEFS